MSKVDKASFNNFLEEISGWNIEKIEEELSKMDRYFDEGGAVDESMKTVYFTLCAVLMEKSPK